MTSYEPYVAEPAEPARRRRLAAAAPGVWLLAVVVLLVALLALWRLGDATEDPAVGEPPGQAPAEQED